MLIKKRERRMSRKTEEYKEKGEETNGEEKITKEKRS